MRPLRAERIKSLMGVVLSKSFWVGWTGLGGATPLGGQARIRSHRTESVGGWESTGHHEDSILECVSRILPRSSRLDGRVSDLKAPLHVASASSESDRVRMPPTSSRRRRLKTTRFSGWLVGPQLRTTADSWSSWTELRALGSEGTMGRVSSKMLRPSSYR